MSEQYTYAVARIRALEVSLLSDSVIEQLLACSTYEQCLQFLTEKGWGDTQGSQNAEEMLKREEEKIWEVLSELSVPMDVFHVLFYPKLFHNLKAAIKQICTEKEVPNVFYEDVSISGEEMMDIIQKKEYEKLPKQMQKAAREAYEALLHTRDGQLCDVIIDRATLDAIYEAGQESKEEIIRNYAESTVAIADIKIAVRAQKTGKSLEFMRRSMAECKDLNVEALSMAALNSVDAICEYLSGTPYAEGAEALKESPSAFERWCDNRMIETIRPQKYDSFSVGPLVAYEIARENEIKTVRIILTGKQNGFSDEAIRERVREMYV